MIRLGVTCLLVALPGAAAAQDMDIVEQRVRVDVAEGFHVEVDALVRTEDAAGVLWLPRFLAEVSSLTLDGVDAAFEPHPAYPDQVVQVTLPERLPSGSEMALHVELDGAPRCRRGAPPGAAWCWHDATETILPGSYAGAWYVSNLLAVDPFLGVVDVRAPNGHVVYAGHGSVSETVDEGATTLWRFPLETPTDLLGLYAGDADVATGDGFPFDVVHHADRDDPVRVQRLADLGAQLYPLYAELFGVLPTARAQIVLVPRSFAVGGLGVMGRPFIGEYVVAELDYLLEQGAAHELAHSFWGGVASAGRPEEGSFMQEAFAEYSAWRALGELQGPAVRVGGNRMNATFYMYRRPGDQDVAILAPDAARHPAFIHAAYHKGSQILRMLEERVGADAFTDALRALLARGPGGLSVAGLVEELGAASGEDVGAIVEPWLRAPGYPVLTASAHGVELDGAFDLVVPVRETFSDGTQRDRRLDLTSGSHPVERGDSVLLEIDPDWTLVRDVRPAVEGDVTLDGRVDAADLVAVALRVGTSLPEERRRDGGYDPLYDLDSDLRVDASDIDRILALAR